VGSISASKSTLLLEAPNQMPVHQLVNVNTETDEARMKQSKNGKTTLTIVQDFPKKLNDKVSTMNLVQAKDTIQ
jgi:hypothetical protein